MNRNISLIYFYTIGIGSVFSLPVLVLYYRDVIGLSFQDFLIGEAVFAATVLLMEVPTGWLADTWGRRNTLQAGIIFAIGGYTALALAESFPMALAAQALLGIAVSMQSGTLSALLYDTLLSHNREHEFERREGTRHGLSLYAVAAATASGGLLYHVHHHAPIFLQIVVLVTTAISTLFLIEPARHKTIERKNPLRDMIETCRYTLRGHPEIGLLIVSMALVFSATKLFLWAQQPYVAALNIPESVYGFILASAQLVGGLAGQHGYRVWRFLQGLVLARALIVVTVAISVLAGMALTVGGLLLLPLGSVIFGFAMPRVQSWINHRVGSERRATILSTIGFSTAILFIPGSLLMGALSESMGIGAALCVQGLIVMVIGFALMRFRPVAGNANFGDER